MLNQCRPVARVGAAVLGFDVEGTNVGVFVGESVGMDEGMTVGEAVGPAVGVAVGLAEGARVGTEEGNAVGVAVGNNVEVGKMSIAVACRWSLVLGQSADLYVPCV